MKVIHFSTDNVTGINLSAERQENGDVSVIRTFQSAIGRCPPETFTIRAEERHALMEYLSEIHSEGIDK